MPGRSQPVVTPVPEALMMLFPGLRRHQAHMWNTYIHAGKTLIDVKENKSIIKKEYAKVKRFK